MKKIEKKFLIRNAAKFTKNVPDPSKVRTSS